MRKALFAIVLVSSSFAGGAVINGPGLRWAQAFLMSRLSVGGEGDDADVDGSASSDPIEEIPSRPIPPLVVTPATPSETKITASPTPDESHSKLSASSTPSASHLPGLAPVPEGPSSPGPTAREPVPPPAVVTATVPPPPSETVREPEPVTIPDKTSDPTIRKVSLPNPGDDTPPSPSPSPSPLAGSTDWTEVRETMRTLGVSRYGTEGEPGGRVRFYCVIPLAGRRAVSQHFEAEGDDDLQAARAALKRVALWKATEGNDNAP